jgi:predicted transcriptional regulator
MNQITIRGLGPEIENKIRRIARDRHQSINYILTEIIRENFEKKNKIPAAASLKHLTGTWKKEEAEDFLNSIKSCEQIDEEIWR